MSLHDPKFVYHPSTSHVDGSEFKQRQRDRMRKAQATDAVTPRVLNKPFTIRRTRSAQH